MLPICLPCQELSIEQENDPTTPQLLLKLTKSFFTNFKRWSPGALKTMQWSPGARQFCLWEPGAHWNLPWRLGARDPLGGLILSNTSHVILWQISQWALDSIIMQKYFSNSLAEAFCWRSSSSIMSIIFYTFHAESSSSLKHQEANILLLLSVPSRKWTFLFVLDWYWNVPQRALICFAWCFCHLCLTIAVQ